MLEIDWQKSINRELVFCALSTKDLVTGTRQTPVGSSTKLTRGPYGQMVESTSNTTGGVHYNNSAANVRKVELTNTVTIMILAELDDAASYGMIFGIPYFNNSWGTPYHSLSMTRLSTSTTCSYQTNMASGRENVNSGTGFWQFDGSLHQYAVVTEGSSTVRFYKDGAQHSTATNTDYSTSHYLLGDATPHVMTRNNGGLEGADGRMYYAAIWNRALSAAEIAHLYAHKFTMFKSAYRDLPLLYALTGAGTVTKTASLNAILQATQSKAASVDAVLQKTALLTSNVNAILALIGSTKATSLDSVMQATLTKTTSISGVLQSLQEITTSLDSVLQATQIKTASLDSILQSLNVKTASLDAILKQSLMKTTGIDAILVANANALLVSLTAVLQKTLAVTASVDAVLKSTSVKTASLDAVINITSVLSASLNAVMQKTISISASLSAVLLKPDLTITANLDAVIQTAVALVKVLTFAVSSVINESYSAKSEVKTTAGLKSEVTLRWLRQYK